MCAEKDLDDLLLNFPGLTATNVEGKVTLRGTIKMQHSWYRLQLCCPHFPHLQELRLSVQLLHEVYNYNADSLGVDPKGTVQELLPQLPTLLAHTSRTFNATTVVPPSAENIYQEIALLHSPHAYQIQLNETCSRIRFCKFAQQEQHYLELELPGLLVVEHSLPDGVDWREQLHKCATLTLLLQQFVKYLEELRPFYENFSHIDELCYVVQPATPTTKHNWRLFLLRQRVFLKLTLADPFAPLASMSLHIIGPTHDVAQLRRIYSEGLHSWDADLDIHKNLLRIFDLCFFPMPPSTLEADDRDYGDAGEDSMERFCSICYCYQLERGEIPIVSCDNQQCSLIYHAACLKEWFSTLSDGKVFLDVAFGACPSCKTKLSTSFAEVLVD